MLLRIYNEKYYITNEYYKKNDSYIFYVNQGYYKANCEVGEPIELYDFMTGKAVYKDKCNDNHEFSIDPGKKVRNLQLYKYELKKDKGGSFYLYGYNPVKKVDKD